VKKINNFFTVFFTFFTVFKRVKKIINFFIVFLSVARPHVGKPESLLIASRGQAATKLIMLFVVQVGSTRNSVLLLT
jgi:hypothetical protein